MEYLIALYKQKKFGIVGIGYVVLHLIDQPVLEALREYSTQTYGKSQLYRGLI